MLPKYLISLHFKSKGGVLLLRVLVEANNGKLTYNYSNGILWSSVELEVD